MTYKKERYMEWYLKNKEKIRNQQKQYYQNHKEERKQYNREYHKENREKILPKMREYKLKNRDYFLEINKKYYQNNKDRYRQWAKEWRSRPQNKEKRRLGGKKEKNFIKFMTLQKISKKQIPECIKCGEKDIRILTVNHINGINGNKHLERTGIYRKILNGKRTIDDLEVKCFNCNILYEYERGNRFFDVNILEEKLKQKGIIKDTDSIWEETKNGAEAWGRHQGDRGFRD